MNIFYAIGYKDHVSLSVDRDVVSTLVRQIEDQSKKFANTDQFDRVKELLDMRLKLLGALEEKTDE